MCIHLDDGSSPLICVNEVPSVMPKSVVTRNSEATLQCKVKREQNGCAASEANAPDCAENSYILSTSRNN